MAGDGDTILGSIRQSPWEGEVSSLLKEGGTRQIITLLNVQVITKDSKGNDYSSLKV